jgi:hypothetical protein
MGLGKRQALGFALEYGGRMFGYIFPNMSIPIVLAIMAGWIGYLVVQFTAWNIFWTSWFGIGLLVIARYNGVVFDHYLLFLLPPMLLGLGSVISWMSRNRIVKIVIYLLVIFIACVQVTRSDIWKQGANDLKRIDVVTDAIIQDAKQSPFSFTLVAGPSFSDLHYRYFFLRKGIHPQPINPKGNIKLYVACDSVKCPSESELLNRKLQVVCFDEHCEGIYPEIDLLVDFRYDKTLKIPLAEQESSMIYVFSSR